MEDRSKPDPESRRRITEHLNRLLGLKEAPIFLLDPEEGEARLDPDHVSLSDLERMYDAVATDHSKRLYFDNHLAFCLIFGDEDARLVKGGTSEGAERFKAIMAFSRRYRKSEETDRYRKDRESLMGLIAPTPPPSSARSRRETYAYHPLSFRELDFLLLQMTEHRTMRMEYQRLATACKERKVPRQECRRLFEMLLGPRQETRKRGGVPMGDTMRTELLLSQLSYWAASLKKAYSAHPTVLAKLLDEFEADVERFIPRIKQGIVFQHDLPLNKSAEHFPKKDRSAAELYARMVRRTMSEAGLAKLDEPDDMRKRERRRGNLSLLHKRFDACSDHWPTEGKLRFFHTDRADHLDGLLGHL